MAEGVSMIVYKNTAIYVNDLEIHYTLDPWGVSGYSYGIYDAVYEPVGGRGYESAEALLADPNIPEELLEDARKKGYIL